MAGGNSDGLPWSELLDKENSFVLQQRWERTNSTSGSVKHLKASVKRLWFTLRCRLFTGSRQCPVTVGEPFRLLARQFRRRSHVPKGAVKPDFSDVRPHSSLGYLPLPEFSRHWAASTPVAALPSLQLPSDTPLPLPVS